MLTLTKNKKFFGLIMLIFTILAFYYTTYAVVSPKTNFYVNDYADVLSEETENYILNSNIDLQSKTKAQIVVVTVKTLDGKTIEEYATELFREFGIGDKEKNNGVLLLCSTGDRMFRIEVGYGLEGALPDGKTGRIQDQYIIPYLKNNNYDEGIKNGFSAILEEVCKEYNIEISGAQKSKLVQDSSDEVFMVLIMTSLIISTIMKFISKNIVKLIYLGIIFIVSWIVIKSFSIAIIILLINMAIVFVKDLGGGYSGGGSSSGGGFSGGGGRQDCRCFSHPAGALRLGAAPGGPELRPL